MVDLASGTGYNPAQQAVIALLGRPDVSPTFPAGLAAELRDEMEEALGPVTHHLTSADPLWVSKHALTTIHGCEAHHVESARERFEWTVPAARGTVAHKAIELSVHWQGEAAPMDLVDEAIARLVDDDRQGIQRFLGGLGPGDRAELRGLAVDLVSSFQECFPALRSAWIPVTESRVRVELCGGAVVLSGKTDLSLGRASGLVANKVIIDLKSGRPSLDPSGGSALLRAVGDHQARRPPAPARLLLPGIRPGPAGGGHRRAAALGRPADDRRRDHDGRAASRRPSARLQPGPTCRWCSLRTTCVEGLAELARREEVDDDGW